MLRLGIGETRKQKWEHLAILFYISRRYTNLRSAFVTETGRIALYSFEDINTLAEVNKEGEVFPVGIRYFGKWE